VTDHARGILTVLEKGELGEIYNIGGSYTCRNKELIQKVLRLMGKPNELIVRVEDRKGHDRRYALDCSKIFSLGWTPRVPFDRGLEETIVWYTENRAWWQPIKTGEYLEYYRRHYHL